MTTAIVEEDEWSIVNEQVELMTIDDIYADNDHEWEFCDHHDDNDMAISSSSASSSSVDGMMDSAPIPIVGGYVRVSYKDMLLKKRIADESIAATHSSDQEITPRQPWRPRIEVTSTPWKRVDREYGPNSSQLGGCCDEYDDWGMEDIIGAELEMKSHVGYCRVKAITMLPPKQLEKKQLRIAQKVATTA